MARYLQPVPKKNCSHAGSGSEPRVSFDTTKGHRNDEKHKIDKQAAHGNLKQNTSNRRSG